jgi:hypothetical protein
VRTADDTSDPEEAGLIIFVFAPVPSIGTSAARKFELVGASSIKARSNPRRVLQRCDCQAGKMNILSFCGCSGVIFNRYKNEHASKKRTTSPFHK